MSDELSQGRAGLVGLWSLRSHLEAALELCWRGAIAHLPKALPDALPKVTDWRGQIALRRVDAPTGVVYSSAIALRLAANLGIPSADLAAVLAQNWPPSTGDTASWADSLLRVTPKHLVQIHLGDRLLAMWLQQFARPIHSNIHSKSPEFSPSLALDHALPRSALPMPAQRFPGRFQDQYQDQYFEMQAAHARCCSLLALAERVGLVRFEVQSAIDSELVWPAPLPWLKAEGTLRTQQPVERRLIEQLLDSGDAIELGQHRLAIAQTQALVRCLYDFDADCRIFGDVAANQPELAQARLGLVRAAQRTLRWLLEGPLQVAAPASL